MNAINHAATALLINRRWPGVPIILVLISVQLVELLWVGLNLLGVEVTTIAPRVRALNDIHLTYMPYSHSIAATVVIAAVAWVVVAKLFARPAWAFAVAAAISSHIILDLATHVPDIALAPGINSPKLGTGLYAVPTVALVVETIFGVACWRIFRGSKTLLAGVVALNLAALSFYSPSISGPEHLLAGHPKVFAAIIGLHIVIGLAAVGLLARARWRLTAD
jgi:hypothetical protein